MRVELLFLIKLSFTPLIYNANNGDDYFAIKTSRCSHLFL